MMEVVKIGKAMPNPETIQTLKSLLKHAEDGNVANFAYVCEFNNKVVRTYTYSDDKFVLISLLEWLKHRVYISLDNNESPVDYADDGGD